MKHLLLTLATVLLVSCGGGDPSPEPAAEVVQAPQAAADAASAPGLEQYVTDQLFVYAEKEYKELFPGGSANLFSGPWTYRYYPGLGYYVGIVTTPTEGFTLGDVYVMGNEFGNEPLNVGPVTRFFTPRPPFAISSSNIYVTDGQEGGTYTLRGVSLKDIKTLKLAGISATIVSHTEEALAFKLPPKTNNVGSLPPCGQLIATTSSSTHMVGAYASDRACKVTIGEVQVAQTYTEPTTNQTIDLIPFKRTMVRVGVSTTPDIKTVAMQVQVQVSGQLSAPIKFTAPKQPSEEFTDGSSYNALVDGSLIPVGATFVVTVNPNWEGGKPQVRSFTPRYDNTGDIDIVLIPIVDDTGKMPELPKTEDVAKWVQNRLPFDQKTTKVYVGKTMTVNYGLDTYDGINSALIELMGHKSRNTPRGERSIYYGYWTWRGTGVVGIAYINSSVSMGVTNGGPRVIAHELGHALGIYHAPCGGVAGPDNDFPYPGGRIGPIKPFDVDTAYTMWHENATDIMGYCGGDWFSDYNFKKIQETIDKRRAWTLDAVADDGTYNVYLVSGTTHKRLVTGVPRPEGAKEQSAGVYVMEVGHDGDAHVYVSTKVPQATIKHRNATHSIVQAR